MSSHIKEITEKELWETPLHELGFYIRRGKFFDVIGIANESDLSMPYEIVLQNIGYRLSENGGEHETD